MNKSDFDWSWLDFMMRLAYPEKYAKDYQEWFSGDGRSEEGGDGGDDGGFGGAEERRKGKKKGKKK